MIFDFVTPCVSHNVNAICPHTIIVRCPTLRQQEPAGSDEEESPATVSSSESKRDEPAARLERGRTALDRQLRRAMDANLQELELMHKRVKKRAKKPSTVSTLLLLCVCMYVLTQDDFVWRTTLTTEAEKIHTHLLDNFRKDRRKAGATVKQ